jgi:hypothetical protein
LVRRQFGLGIDVRLHQRKNKYVLTEILVVALLLVTTTTKRKDITKHIVTFELAVEKDTMLSVADIWGTCG